MFPRPPSPPPPARRTGSPGVGKQTGPLPGSIWFALGGQTQSAQTWDGKWKRRPKTRKTLALEELEPHPINEFMLILSSMRVFSLFPSVRFAAFRHRRNMESMASDPRHCSDFKGEVEIGFGCQGGLRADLGTQMDRFRMR